MLIFPSWLIKFLSYSPFVCLFTSLFYLFLFNYCCLSSSLALFFPLFFFSFFHVSRHFSFSYYSYDIMCQCWRFNPKMRPSFQQLQNILQMFLDNYQQPQQVNYIIIHAHINCTIKRASTNTHIIDYIVMVLKSQKTLLTKSLIIL